MEESSAKEISAGDQIPHCLFILTQIQQFHDRVTNELKDPSANDKKQIEELIMPLIPIIHDLSKTFCNEINRTTEILQSTLHLLKTLQDGFQKQNVPTEPVQYLLDICQTLDRTARDLKLAKGQLNNITAQYKDTVKKKRNSAVEDKFTSGDTEGFITDKQITCTTETPDLKEIVHQDEESTTNTQRHDIDKMTISVTNDLASSRTSAEEETQQAQENMENTNNEPFLDKRIHSPDGPMASNCKMNIKTDQQGEDASVKTKIMDTSEVKFNGTTEYHSEVHLLDSNKWTYRECTIRTKGEDEEQLACFIKAPSTVLQGIKCRFMDEISSLVVSDGEELVSNVLNISSHNDTELKLPFPISISIPFNSHYRGSYRDVMVKTIDENLQASYLTPSTLDGYHGNHKGSFAEIKVYKLGTFSVISCLKKENFTILRKGLSVKLSVDSRISLNYPPSCFSSAVIAQFKVQPVDTSLISLLKLKHDIYHPVVSSSPLIHMKQPSVQVFHKPVTVLLPCPPNPEKKKAGDDTDKRISSASILKSASVHQIRAISASARKHGDNPSELLKLLALKEDQWIVLDDIVVKNVQNGIVSFELSEHIQSFIVFRLSSALDNVHLLQFIQSLECAIHSSMVNVVLHRRKDNPYNIIVQLVPSKELNWEMSALDEAGYTGPPEPSEPIGLQEGDQIHFKFCGNISASDGEDSSGIYKLRFHCQKMQQLSLKLSVVDEYGNYSSPHYKGMVAFYKLLKDDIVASYKSGQSNDESLQQCMPVCKLLITLPKVEKIVSRPSSTKLKTSNPGDLLWDSVLKWVANNVSEDDAAELLLSLPIRRSTVQLVRLKSPDNLAGQVYELLSLWKKRLPTSTDKFRLLARHLNKSGRSDLVEQMKVQWEAKISLTTNH
ncbi:death domain-containing protein 1 [Gastrophryne carolinensis]